MPGPDLFLDNSALFAGIASSGGAARALLLLAEAGLVTITVSEQVDVPIVVAAMRVETDYLVTFNRRHFMDDASVAARSGLRIGTPGDALDWVRGRLAMMTGGIAN